MKIAVLADGRDPMFGGGQVHIRYLCSLLVKKYDTHVHLITRKLVSDTGEKFRQHQEFFDGQWEIFRIGPIGYFFSLMHRFINLFVVTGWFFLKARKEKYDIIHAHSLLYGLPAWIVGRLLRIPVVYTIHGTMHLDAKKGWMSRLEKFFVCWLSYDVLISVSKKVLDYKPRSKRVEVIYNGVDIQSYDEVIQPNKYSGFTILTVGRMDWQKNHQIVLLALAHMDRSSLDRSGFQRRLVGDGILRQELEQKVQDLGLEKYVTFVGKLFGDDLIREYKKNHLFLLPSLAEGQPLTILEAFASKLSVVATRVGDNDAFVFDEVNGFLFPAGDIQATKSILQKCITLSSAKLSELGEHGYDFVHKNYTRDICVSKTYAIYQSLL